MTMSKLEQDLVSDFETMNNRQPLKHELIELNSLEAKYDFLYARLLALEALIKQPKNNDII